MMRKRFRAHRAALPASAVAQRSQALGERLLALDALASAECVALFWPIEHHHEVDLRGVDAALRERGISLAYPAIDPQTRVMTFHLVADPQSLTLSELGFLAPSLSSPMAEHLDVVLVPGLAFDPQGYRIGYGGGFYDQALPSHCPPALAIGVAFDFQLAADIPFEPCDVTVDVIVTDRRVLPVTAP